MTPELFVRAARHGVVKTTTDKGKWRHYESSMVPVVLPTPKPTKLVWYPFKVMTLLPDWHQDKTGEYHTTQVAVPAVTPTPDRLMRSKLRKPDQDRTPLQNLIPVALTYRHNVTETYQYSKTIPVPTPIPDDKVFTMHELEALYDNVWLPAPDLFGRDAMLYVNADNSGMVMVPYTYVPFYEQRGVTPCCDACTCYARRRLESFFAKRLMADGMATAGILAAMWHYIETGEFTLKRT